jgi:hypothetical protein
MNAKPATQAPKVAKAPKADKAEKPKKVKVVRDSFTIPKPEFEKIDVLKKRALTLGVSVKKSELLRAGLLVLSGLSDTAFKAAVATVPVLKTGRPEADKAKTSAQPAVKKTVAKKLVTPRRPVTKKAVAKRPVPKKAQVAAKKVVSKKVATQKATPVKAVAKKA